MNKKTILMILYFAVPLVGAYLLMEIFEFGRIVTYTVGLGVGVIAGLVLSHI